MLVRADDLGGHPAEGFTLHEVGELLRRHGRASGFIVETEHRPIPGRKHAIDWVWISGKSGRVVAAFEIEGRDVDVRSTQRDAMKMLSIPTCSVRAIVLFQVNHNRLPKKIIPFPVDRVRDRAALQGKKIDVFLDTDLAGGALDQIVTRCRRAR